MTRRIAACFFAAALAACGPDDDPAASTPVAETPLTGTIDGQPWTAVAAFAEEGWEEGEKRLTIVDAAGECSFSGAPRTERMIIASVPWKDGEAYDLSMSHNITFVIDRGPDDIMNKVVLSGRVEIISAPTAPGASGRIRVRGSSGGDKVEGQIDVTVCN